MCSLSYLICLYMYVVNIIRVNNTEDIMDIKNIMYNC